MSTAAAELKLTPQSGPHRHRRSFPNRLHRQPLHTASADEASLIRQAGEASLSQPGVNVEKIKANIAAAEAELGDGNEKTGGRSHCTYCGFELDDDEEGDMHEDCSRRYNRG